MKISLGSAKSLAAISGGNINIAFPSIKPAHWAAMAEGGTIRGFGRFVLMGNAENGKTLSATDARQGQSGLGVRYVLTTGLIGAIIGFLVIYMLYFGR